MFISNLCTQSFAKPLTIYNFLSLQSDDFLVLPEGVHLEETKTILDAVNANNVHVSVDKNIKRTTAEPSSSSVLKLRGSAGILYIFMDRSILVQGV